MIPRGRERARAMSAEFIEAMRAAGVDPGAAPIIPDAALHRFRGPSDKPGRENCWYVLFEGGGAFGSWRSGISQKWHNGTSKFPKEERRKLDQQIKEAQARAEAERKKRQDAAAEKARRLWGMAVAISEASPHDYLLRKHVQPHGARRLGNALCIPLYAQESDQIVSLQFIQPGGEKTFLTDGRVAGCYYWLADEALNKVTRVGIAEGFATAASTHEATGMPVAVAFN